MLGTAPLRMASDPSNGAIAHWKHGALHDVVAPMADHVVMTYPTGLQRLERRSGKSVAIGTARSGVVTIIPAGSSARWDIPGPVNVVQLYLPHTTLERVAGEANTTAPGDLLERTGHPDPVTSRLLMSAADVLEGSAALDALVPATTDGSAGHAPAGCAFRLAGHVPAGHGRPLAGDVAPRHRTPAFGQRCGRLACALASDAGLSRFHFCRAFKESTGLSPHAWLRQHRLEQAMNMLRDTDASVVSVAAALGYSSQTAFAAAFQEADRRNPERLAQALALAAIALQVRQSLWGRCQVGSLMITVSGLTTAGRQTMTWKNLVSPLAITSRRRVVASAVMYGLSLRSASLRRRARKWKFRRSP